MAVLFLLVAPTLLMIEHSVAEINIGQVGRELILFSVVFFSYSMVELAVIGLLKDKDSPYYVGAHLLFSLLRLVLTAAILFYFKWWQDSSNFSIVFVNVLVLYFTTLLYSTWRRQKENK